MAYVYIYLDPRFNPAIPIYIGKGQGDRLFHHINKKCKNTILKNKINAIKKMSLEPIIEKVKNNISHKEASILEKKLILEFGRIDLKTGTLCNLTDGGEGSPGRIPSEATKILWSLQRKGKKQTEAQYKANCNRIVSDETKQKISKTNKGKDFLTKEQREIIRLKNLNRKHSTETKKLFSLQRKGKKQTEAQYKANCNRIPITKQVKCLNNDRIYKNAKKAAEDLKLNIGAIHSVCNGTRKHHKQYKFQYIN